MRRILLLYWSVIIVSTALAATGSVDRFVRPPLTETYFSPNRLFRLVIEAKDRWRTPVSTATLYRTSSKEAVWSCDLPNFRRPRFVAVSNAGYTTTLDDWENTRTPNAAVVYDPTGRAVATHSNYE